MIFQFEQRDIWMACGLKVIDISTKIPRLLDLKQAIGIILNIHFDKLERVFWFDEGQPDVVNLLAANVTRFVILAFLLCLESQTPQFD